MVPLHSLLPVLRFEGAFTVNTVKIRDEVCHKIFTLKELFHRVVADDVAQLR